MKTFSITEQYYSTITYTVQAETEDDAIQQIREGSVQGDFETDFNSGEITNVEDISDQFPEGA